jgi:hypothetical protein
MYNEENMNDIEAIKDVDEHIKIQLDEVMNQQKRKDEEDKKRKEMDEKIEYMKAEQNQKILEQTFLLNEYISAFVTNVGRKPDSDEIALNMGESIHPEILASFLEDYNFNDFMNV